MSSEHNLYSFRFSLNRKHRKLKERSVIRHLFPLRETSEQDVSVAVVLAPVKGYETSSAAASDSAATNVHSSLN